MDVFLTESKKKLNTITDETKVHVVLGNEACDLDSAVSALVYAYYLHSLLKTEEADNVVHIPVLNIPQQDYSLRTEVTHCLRANQIADNTITFRDEIDLRTLHEKHQLILTLVDHNVLVRTDSYLDGDIVSIVDHHSNGRHDDEDRDIDVTREMTGSCSTLVAEKILSNSKEILDDVSVTLLLGTVLVDTFNMSESAKKATPKDKAVVAELLEICPHIERQELFEGIEKVKFDVSGLSTTDLLRKDYKSVLGEKINIGMSSITLHIKDILQRPSLEDDLQSFCTAKSLHLLVLVNMYRVDKEAPQRQLGLYAPGTQILKDNLVKILQETDMPSLQLSQIESTISSVVAFEQGNVFASRKKLMPIVQQFLEDSERDYALVKEILDPDNNSSTVDLLGGDLLSTLNPTEEHLQASFSTNQNNSNVDDDPFGLGSALSPTGSSHSIPEQVLNNDDPFGFGSLSSVDQTTSDMSAQSANSDDPFGLGTLSFPDQPSSSIPMQNTNNADPFGGLESLNSPNQKETLIDDPFGLGSSTSLNSPSLPVPNANDDDPFGLGSSDSLNSPSMQVQNANSDDPFGLGSLDSLNSTSNSEQNANNDDPFGLGSLSSFSSPSPNQQQNARLDDPFGLGVLDTPVHSTSNINENTEASSSSSLLDIDLSGSNDLDGSKMSGPKPPTLLDLDPSGGIDTTLSVEVSLPSGPTTLLDPFGSVDTSESAEMSSPDVLSDLTSSSSSPQKPLSLLDLDTFGGIIDSASSNSSIASPLTSDPFETSTVSSPGSTPTVESIESSTTDPFSVLLSPASTSVESVSSTNPFQNTNDSDPNGNDLLGLCDSNGDITLSADVSDNIVKEHHAGAIIASEENGIHQNGYDVFDIGNTDGLIDVDSTSSNKGNSHDILDLENPKNRTDAANLEVDAQKLDNLVPMLSDSKPSSTSTSIEDAKSDSISGIDNGAYLSTESTEPSSNLLDDLANSSQPVTVDLFGIDAIISPNGTLNGTDAVCIQEGDQDAPVEEQNIESLDNADSLKSQQDLGNGVHKMEAPMEGDTFDEMFVSDGNFNILSNPSLKRVPRTPSNSVSDMPDGLLSSYDGNDLDRQALVDKMEELHRSKSAYDVDEDCDIIVSNGGTQGFIREESFSSVGDGSQGFIREESFSSVGEDERTTSPSSETVSDDVSNSSSGESYTVNDECRGVDQFAITQIQEAEEEEEEEDEPDEEPENTEEESGELNRIDTLQDAKDIPTILPEAGDARSSMNILESDKDALAQSGSVLEGIVSENVPENVLQEDVPENIPEDIIIEQDILEKVPKPISEDVPENVPEDGLENVLDSTPEGVCDTIPEDVSESVPEEVPDDIATDIEDYVNTIVQMSSFVYKNEIPSGEGVATNNVEEQEIPVDNEGHVGMPKVELEQNIEDTNEVNNLSLDQSKDVQEEIDDKEMKHMDVDGVKPLEVSNESSNSDEQAVIDEEDILEADNMHQIHTENEDITMATVSPVHDGNIVKEIQNSVDAMNSFANKQDIEANKQDDIEEETDKLESQENDNIENSSPDIERIESSKEESKIAEGGEVKSENRQDVDSLDNSIGEIVVADQIMESNMQDGASVENNTGEIVVAKPLMESNIQDEPILDDSNGEVVLVEPTEKDNILDVGSMEYTAGEVIGKELTGETNGECEAMESLEEADVKTVVEDIEDKIEMEIENDDDATVATVLPQDDDRLLVDEVHDYVETVVQTASYAYKEEMDQVETYMSSQNFQEMETNKEIDILAENVESVEGEITVEEENTNSSSIEIDDTNNQTNDILVNVGEHEVSDREKPNNSMGQIIEQSQSMIDEECSEVIHADVIETAGKTTEGATSVENGGVAMETVDTEDLSDECVNTGREVREELAAENVDVNDEGNMVDETVLYNHMKNTKEQEEGEEEKEEVGDEVKGYVDSVVRVACYSYQEQLEASDMNAGGSITDEDLVESETQSESQLSPIAVTTDITDPAIPEGEVIEQSESQESQSFTPLEKNDIIDETLISSTEGAVTEAVIAPTERFATETIISPVETALIEAMPIVPTEGTVTETQVSTSESPITESEPSLSIEGSIQEVTIPETMAGDMSPSVDTSTSVIDQSPTAENTPEKKFTLDVSDSVRNMELSFDETLSPVHPQQHFESTPIRPDTLELSDNNRGGKTMIHPTYAGNQAYSNNAGTPASLLSDDGGSIHSVTTLDAVSMFPITPSPGSLSECDADSLDGADLDSGKPPFPKRLVSVDSTMAQDISGDWTGEREILDAAAERLRQKQPHQNSRQGSTPKLKEQGRQLSVASAEAKQRMEGVEIPEEWQDDELNQQRLYGHDDVDDIFYKRSVPKMDSIVEGDRPKIEEDVLARIRGNSDMSVETNSSFTSDGRQKLRVDSDLRRLRGDSSMSERSQDRGREDSDVSDATMERFTQSLRRMSEDSLEDDLEYLHEEGEEVDGDPLGARPKKRIPAELNLDTDDDHMNGRATGSQSTNGASPAMLSPTSMQMSWDDDGVSGHKPEKIPEYTAKEEMEDNKNWRRVVISGKEHAVDMRAINPYKKVLSHGGYYGDGLNAIIVFASCYMPDKSRKDYNYVMHNLFLYVVSTLELLVAQDYIIVYFHGAAPKSRIPSLGWMRKCYKMIDRKLRKNLKGLYLVHPTTWLKTVVRLTRPFVSSKFSSKLKFIYALEELEKYIPMDFVYIPDEVKRYDERIKRKKKSRLPSEIEAKTNDDEGWLRYSNAISDDEYEDNDFEGSDLSSIDDLDDLLFPQFPSERNSKYKSGKDFDFHSPHSTMTDEDGLAGMESDDSGCSDHEDDIHIECVEGGGFMEDDIFAYSNGGETSVSRMPKPVFMISQKRRQSRTSNEYSYPQNGEVKGNEYSYPLNGEVKELRPHNTNI